MLLLFRVLDYVPHVGREAALERDLILHVCLNVLLQVLVTQPRDLSKNSSLVVVANGGYSSEEIVL